MSESFNKFKCASIAVLTTSLIMSVIRIALLANNVEITGGIADKYYLISVNGFTVSFAVAAAVIALAIIIVSFCKLSGNISVFEPLTPGFVVDISAYPSTVLFTSALSGFLLISSGIYYVYLYIFENTCTTWEFFLAVLMIVSSFGYLYSSFLAKGKSTPSFSVLFRLVPVFFGIYWLMYEFIEQNQYAINSSCVFHILSLVFLMMFFTYEAQNASGKLRPSVYCAVALLSVFFLFLDALPNLILSCFWMLKLDVMVLLDAIQLVLAMYAFSKVYSIKINTEETDV